MRSTINQCYPQCRIHGDGSSRVCPPIHQHQTRSGLARDARPSCQPMAAYRYGKYVHWCHLRFRNLYRSHDWYHAMLVIPDLYIGDSSSIYWYWHGFHWRTILAFLLGFCPLFPGFIMNLMGNHTDSGWVKLFQITFLVGLSIGFVSFLVICLVSPPPHYKEGENFLVSPT
jgi:hypothetical protein